MLAQRLRRWPNIVPTLAERLFLWVARLAPVDEGWDSMDVVIG